MNGSVFLIYSTFYWISALIFLTTTYHIGATRVVSPKFDAENMLKIIETYKVSAAFIPPIYTYSLTNLKGGEKYDTSSLLTLLTGSTTFTSEQIIKTKNLFKYSEIIVWYGTTETFIITCFDKLRDKHLLNRTGSSGKCVMDVEIKIVDPETKKLLGSNQNGEICVRTLFGMNGYYKMDATSTYDEDGFIKTGDIGYYDVDECFYIVNRIKEMFKYKTWHVIPAYLESIIEEHPAVKEVAVFGLPHDIDGHLPAACIILKDNCLATQKDINTFISGKVSDWHKLRGGIKFVDSLPRTPSLKLQRTKLKELYLAN